MLISSVFIWPEDVETALIHLEHVEFFFNSLNTQLRL